MKIRVRNICRFGENVNGTIIAAGAIRQTKQVPVTVAFDTREPVGWATVYPDGSADISLQDYAATLAFSEYSIGFRGLKVRQQDGALLVEEAEILTVACIPKQHPADS